MLVAFFESMKHVGHLYPVAFLRIFIGYYFFSQALVNFNGVFLTQPRLAAAITEWLPQSGAPSWYAYILEMYVVPNWQVFAYIITYCQFIVGISFIIGFLVRPISILGIFLVANLYFGGGEANLELQKVLVALFITLLWIGGGRCLGIDYFFYKRQRGIWW